MASHPVLSMSVAFYGDSFLPVMILVNLYSGEILEDKIKNTGWSGEWAADNKTFFYTKRDSSQRPYQIWRHTLGQNVDNDVCVYQEDDTKFSVGISKSNSEKYLFIGAGSAVTGINFQKFVSFCSFSTNPSGKF